MTSSNIVPPSPAVQRQLAFDSYPTNGWVSYTWQDGAWGAPQWHPSTNIELPIASVALNYGQSCFEGLKAFRFADNSVHIFRPKDNAARMQHSGDMIGIPEVSEEMFLEGCRILMSRNLEFVPPHAPGGANGSFYLRPLLFGSGGSLNLRSADSFTFAVYGSPVGSLYGSVGGSAPGVDAIVVESFDRAAPLGTGSAKLGGSYAPVLKHTAAAKAAGYGITLHLDSKTRTYIDEFSTSNFLALKYGPSGNKEDVTLVVPESPSILKSITTMSVIDIAAKTFGWKVELRPLAFSEVVAGDFDEVAAAGTAAAITPVRSISYADSNGKTQKVSIGNGQTAGPRWLEVLAELTGVQAGDRPDSYGWHWPKGGVQPDSTPLTNGTRGE